MLKFLLTLTRGAVAAAEEEAVDRHALLILDQQMRDATAAVERSRRALAVAMAQDQAEVLHGAPAASVIEALARIHPDVLVVGTLRRHGLDRVFMGSTAERLVGRAACDVLVVPATAAPAA